MVVANTQLFPLFMQTSVSTIRIGEIVMVMCTLAVMSRRFKCNKVHINRKVACLGNVWMQFAVENSEHTYEFPHYERLQF